MGPKKTVRKSKELDILDGWTIWTPLREEKGEAKGGKINCPVALPPVSCISWSNKERWIWSLGELHAVVPMACRSSLGSASERGVFQQDMARRPAKLVRTQDQVDVVR